VSPGFLVRSWEVVGPAGSDHMGVVVDLLAPAGPASAVAGEEGEGEAGDPYRDFGLP